jgi:hypothetical protein
MGEKEKEEILSCFRASVAKYFIRLRRILITMEARKKGGGKL